MWALLMAALCLAQADGDVWRAGWRQAKARAELRDRFRHKLIDFDTYVREYSRLMTPQQDEELQRVIAEERRRLARIFDRLQGSRHRFAEYQELLAKRQRGRLTAEEEKRLSELMAERPQSVLDLLKEK